MMQKESKKQGPLMPGEEAKGPNVRTMKERLVQVTNLAFQLNSNGFNIKSSDFDEYRKYANDFIKNSVPWSGIVKSKQWPGIKFAITLCLKKTQECSIRIINMNRPKKR